MNGKPLSRNEDGLIKNICVQCGKLRLSRQKKLKPLCQSCGIKKSFKSRPAVGLKTLENIGQIIKEYESGHSLETLGKKYGVSAMTIRAKILAHGGKTRNYSEATTQTNKIHKNIYKAQAKVEELCKTGKFQRDRSAMLQGISIENWKGFITPKNLRLVASPEYKKWQQTVFSRDNRTCQLCGKIKCPIAAHHIYMKAKYPDKVLDVNNGITLCDKCHHKTIGRESEYIDCFTLLLKGDLCGRKQ